MERMQFGKIARACAMFCACACATAALAEPETEMAAIKQSLELEKLKLSVEKDRAELYKSLVPDLSDFKREAPKTTPEVVATSTRLAYSQAALLANELATQVKDNAGNVNEILLDSPHLLGYLSSLTSVETLLESNKRSVENLTTNLDAMVAVKPPVPPPNRKAKSLPAVSAILPVIELGFAVASALRPSYVMGGSRHEDLSTRVLRAQVVSKLGVTQARKDGKTGATAILPAISVYDVDTAIKWPEAPEKVLDGKVKDLRDAIDKARNSLRAADTHVKKLTDEAKPADPDGKPDPALTAHAAVIAAQAKALTTDVDNSAKYLVALHTPSDTGLIPLIAAKRGLWLKDRLDKDPPRLTLTSLVAATDIVAADGWFKGLRVSVAGNTIVEWRLVFPDGRVATGAAQSCEDPTKPICQPLILRADDQVRAPSDKTKDTSAAAGG